MGPPGARPPAHPPTVMRQAGCLTATHTAASVSAPACPVLSYLRFVLSSTADASRPVVESEMLYTRRQVQH
jgi:hypothetical protein